MSKKNNSDTDSIVFAVFLVLAGLVWATTPSPFNYIFGGVFVFCGFKSLFITDNSSSTKNSKSSGLSDWKYNNSEKRKKYSDKELDNYGLDEHEKELVNKGEYEPWNFEEEDLEDDDYYSDDDE